MQKGIEKDLLAQSWKTFNASPSAVAAVGHCFASIAEEVPVEDASMQVEPSTEKTEGEKKENGKEKEKEDSKQAASAALVLYSHLVKTGRSPSSQHWNELKAFLCPLLSDSQLSKFYTLFTISHSSTPSATDQDPISDLHASLLSTAATSPQAKASILISLLTLLLSRNEISHAHAIVQRSTFPSADFTSSAIQAKWAYLVAKLNAIQLAYSDSAALLAAAARSASHPPFVHAVNKCAVIVQLLTGEIPPRAMFTDSQLGAKACPVYLALVVAVRSGSLVEFSAALNAGKAQFEKDGTATLAHRLRHTVINTGLRAISLSYSKISLSDVCLKLGLASVQDAEYIVAKAIRDKILLSSLTRQKDGKVIMVSAPHGDAYVTNEPARVYAERISACQTLYRTAVGAMRYPMKSDLGELDSAEQVRQRDARIINDITDGVDEEDDEMGGDFF